MWNSSCYTRNVRTAVHTTWRPGRCVCWATGMMFHTVSGRARTRALILVICILQKQTPQIFASFRIRLFDWNHISMFCFRAATHGSTLLAGNVWLCDTALTVMPNCLTTANGDMTLREPKQLSLISPDGGPIAHRWHFIVTGMSREGLLKQTDDVDDAKVPETLYAFSNLYRDILYRYNSIFLRNCTIMSPDLHAWRI